MPKIPDMPWQTPHGRFNEIPEPTPAEFVILNIDGPHVEVYACRPTIDTANIGADQNERDVEAVAAFSMPTRGFLNTFGALVDQLRRGH